MFESELEKYAIELLARLGWSTAYGPDIAPGEPFSERTDWREAVLEGRLRQAVERMNPTLPVDAIDDAVKTVLRPESQLAFTENWRAYQLLVGGVPVEYRAADGSVAHDRAWLVDWADPSRNDFLAVNQVTVQGSRERRPDVLCYVNGLPLGLMELKRPGELNASVRGAFNQIQTYRGEIPVAFTWNQITVLSDGVQARAATFTAPFEHYAPWKTIEGQSLADPSIPEIETLLRGLFNPSVFLDVVRNFVVFADEFTGPVKKVAKYHQYWAVRKAVQRTLEAKDADGRAGVVWHTQGSGKSLEMHCYAGAIMRHPGMANPTVVVLTDRNDLDDQLFDEVFASSRPNAPLPSVPVQAESREHLKQWLGGRASGGIMFSTIQKFGLSKEDKDAGVSFPVLSERGNIVVMVDEAHRSNYDFIDGFARNLRDGLPNAIYLGFTGTPIETADRSTRQVFGDYIDVYDLTQAVADGATVKVYYESRLARIELSADARGEIDDAFAEAVSGTEEQTAERLKSRWARVEAVVGSKQRIAELASDIVEHWEQRRADLAGKAMIVTMSRRIAVELYNEIVALRPDWHSDDDELGRMKVVITGSAADDEILRPHIRNKEARRALKARAKNPSDQLELLIVRDMWLTGFDAPSMHTMYVDKPMRGAPLMQAIARINRTFKDKPAGLVVDYIGIADDLQSALRDYTDRDQDNQELGQDIRDQAIPAMVEKHEVVCSILHGYDWRIALDVGGTNAFLNALTGTVNYLMGQHIPDDRSGSAGMCTREDPCVKCRFLEQTRRLVRLFAICSPCPEASAIRDDVAFFDAVRGQISKIEGPDRPGPGSDSEIEAAIKQIVSEATSGAGVVDIYGAAGLTRPDISLIDDAFVENFNHSPNKALSIEVVRRLLQDRITTLRSRNVVVGRQFSEMLAETIQRYQNRTLDSAQVMLELADLARQMRDEQTRGARLGLTNEEIAFYDAIHENTSAVEQLGDETLKKIARELVTIVRRDAKTDWNVKEQVRAKLRTTIKRLLRRYGYPPDEQENATLLVLKQAELSAEEWVA